MGECTAGKQKDLPRFLCIHADFNQLFIIHVQFHT